MSETLKSVESQRRLRIAGAVVLCALGILLVSGQPYVVRSSGYSYLAQHAQELLDESMLENERTFLIFSAVKASLSMIEGSTVGVGVQVQVGDLIQPALDFVDYFWKIFLTAFVVMGFYKILLDAGMLTLGFPLMGIGCILVSSSMVVMSARWNMRALGRRFILLGLLMTYALPISLLASDQISKTYVDKLKQQHQANIGNFQGKLDQTRTKFMALKEEISLLNPSRSIERIETRLVELAQSVAASFHSSFLSFMYFVLIILFELLILPFCTAFILYLLSRRLLEGLVTPKTPTVQIASEAEPVGTK